MARSHAHPCVHGPEHVSSVLLIRSGECKGDSRASRPVSCARNSVPVGRWSNLAMGGRSSAPLELSLLFRSTVRGGLDENCLAED